VYQTLKGIAFKYCNISALKVLQYNMQPVLQYQLQY